MENKLEAATEERVLRLREKDQLFDDVEHGKQQYKKKVEVIIIIHNNNNI